ncbi:hypothetical protein BDF14DRAFT_1835186 [Spinellus fusiger]|nr:hypothetical protein BDF14DRAFT_1835186 [Spinellus fusiger]
MIYCTEVYGQTPEHDDHHEKIKSTKTQILPSSLPQPFTRYPNIEVKIIKNDNSHHIIHSY